MTSKIFRSTVFVAIVVLLCALGIILGVLYSYFDDVQISQLKDELRLAAIGTEESGLGFLQKIDSNHFRLTWVAEDGSVIYDTHVDASTLQNHADRKEIQEALETGSGEDEIAIYARSYKCKYDKETDELISREIEAFSTYYKDI